MAENSQTETPQATPQKKPHNRPERLAGSDWDFDKIRLADEIIGELAEEYGLDTYPNQIEIIRSDQMMDAYASVGMPIGYNHWSYGKQFVSVEQQYQHGMMGLAYEIVINSDPCIAYLMEENTMTMQCLVIAHACYGHNGFFKGNYLFRDWTDAKGVIDYLDEARKYVKQCEEKYGEKEVEMVLDAAHALMNYAVDRYKRPKPRTAEELKQQLEDLSEDKQRNYDDVTAKTISGIHKEAANERNDSKGAVFPPEPEENILRFIRKNAPALQDPENRWKQGILEIVEDMAQYFYPQRQTQVMNEGYATFWHYTLMNRLYDEGEITEGQIMEFLSSHTAVIYQPPFDHPGYRGINPYALGFAIYSDLRRMCENPTEEDREWFPDIAGSDWVETIHHAMRNYKDESFILQYLSPKVMRDMRLFGIVDDEADDAIEVNAIHDKSGYERLRQQLASQYNLGDREPNIQVAKWDKNGDNSLTLRHTMYKNRPLSGETGEVMKHIKFLWGENYAIHMEQEDEHGHREIINTIPGHIGQNGYRNDSSVPQPGTPNP